MTEARQKKKRSWGLLILAVCILIPGGYGFAEKLRQFFYTLNHDSSADFTLVPIANYLIIAAGMACFFAWAAFNGMFRDIEGPKYDMLENEKDLDKREGAAWSE